MKKRPVWLVLLALAYMLAPLGIIIEICWFNRIPIQYLDVAFNKAFWNWHVILIAVTTPLVGLGIWLVRIWGYYAVLAYSGAMIVSNVGLLITNQSSTSFFFNVLFNLCTIAIILIFVRKEVYAPYFNPNLRWWEQARRYAAHDIGVVVKNFGKNSVLFAATSFDLSETGMYLQTETAVRAGDVYSFLIHFSPERVLFAAGEVVWVNAGNSHYPQGFGCKFIATDQTFRQQLKESLQAIHAMVKDRT